MPKPMVKLPALSAWNVEILRLTAFHVPGTQTSDNNWWEDVTKSIPESKTMKPREGGFEVSGPYGGGALTLKADLIRFDWLLTPLISQDAPTPGVPTTGPLPDAMKTFTSLIQAWLPKTPNIIRLAFGAVVSQEVPDRVAGYNLLNNYLPAIELDPEGSTEFSYSINRPRSVTILGGMKINRLSKWSVGRFQAMTLTKVIGQPAITSSLLGDSIHALRLELDINTDEQRNEPLPIASLPELFDCITEFGEEIVQKGDVK